jgi:hypothetical protein
MKAILASLMLAIVLPAAAKGGHSTGNSSHSSYSHSYSAKPSTGTGSKSEHEHVDGYTRKDGTHVNAHERTTADGTKTNNWTTKGNVNPYTGKAGTQ